MAGAGQQLVYVRMEDGAAEAHTVRAGGGEEGVCRECGGVPAVALAHAATGTVVCARCAGPRVVHSGVDMESGRTMVQVAMAELGPTWTCAACGTTEAAVGPGGRLDAGVHAVDGGGGRMDLCLPCFAPRVAPALASVLHPDHLLGFRSAASVYAAFGGTWHCDVCDVTMAPTQPMFSCVAPGHTFDLCAACALATAVDHARVATVANHEHAVAPVAPRPVYWSHNGVWTCDGCRARPAGAVWHCVEGCEFDLCAACVEREWRPPAASARITVATHPHTLYAAGAAAVYPQHGGGWRCDGVCGRSLTDADGPMWHCEDNCMSYDLCDACARIVAVREGAAARPTCVLCRFRPVDAVCVPCGHALVCSPCGSAFVAANGGECPTCRAPDTSIQALVVAAECAVCFGEFGGDELFCLAPECGHMMCVACAVALVRDALGDRTKIPLVCPAFGLDGRPCRTAVEPSSIFVLTRQSDLTADEFATFVTALDESAIAMANRAYCPLAGCGGLVVVDHGECETGADAVRPVACPYCAGVFCWACRNEHHPEQTCADAAAASAATASVIASVSRPCRCGVPIAHPIAHGCHHITHPCGDTVAEWCYVCPSDDNAWPCRNGHALYCVLGECGCVACTDCGPGAPCGACPGNCPVCVPDA